MTALRASRRPAPEEPSPSPEREFLLFFEKHLTVTPLYTLYSSHNNPGYGREDAYEHP